MITRNLLTNFHPAKPAPIQNPHICQMSPYINIDFDQSGFYFMFQILLVNNALSVASIKLAAYIFVAIFLLPF